jgi:hypothetical protein
MKKGEVYVCNDCGLKLEVVEECTCNESTQDCSCYTKPESCSFNCCGEEMQKKA